MRTRHDELAIRKLFRDTITIVDRVVESIAADDVEPARSFGEAVPPVYRRRKVPMHDLVTLANAVRAAIGATLPVAQMPEVDAALDAMIERLQWHGRIAGDAKKRNRLIAAIYKGA
jgi:hypothetical protein